MSKLGLKRGTVRLVSHNPKWRKNFEAEKKKLIKIFGRNALDIQHVGSTSILGVPAKPIVDIAVVAPSLQKAKKYVHALGQIGYHLKKYDKRSKERLFFTKGPEVKRTHYLHIGTARGGYIEDMIVFRNYLRKNKSVARQYVELKRKLEKKYSEQRNLYAKERSKFVDRIAKKAKNEKTKI